MIDLQPVVEIDVESPIGQARAVPVRLGAGAPRAILVTYGADFDVDPYVEMFFFPTDTLKMILFDETGRVHWRRDLGRGVVPGVWFCPFYPFDLDGDGVDEIYYVDNPNAAHPLGLSQYRLTRLDGRSGEPTGHWPWPAEGGYGQSLSHLFRNFIIGGQVRGEPVLLTAQGTYGDMHIQAWNPGMEPRWQTAIAADAPGARGSHMCPVVDLDGDGVDELLWGERAIELDAGREMFCADRDTYRGHSDIVQPVVDRDGGRFYFYTCRESDQNVAPRVALYDARGERIWGDVDEGHVDMGWIARLGDDGRQVAMAVRIGAKVCGPDGRYHDQTDEFSYDALTGEPVELPFSVYRTLPVDLDGDGLHELVRGAPSGDGAVLDRRGNSIADVGAPVALASHFFDRPGEQLLSYHADGLLRVWADRHAADSEAACQRYAHPFYQAAERLGGVGYHWPVLGGI